ncbi:MAG: hypothetical protein M3016_09520 [Actinomycetota bacterium]|nr:hypothetical protein [Actinomycetota bacterium]
MKLKIALVTGLIAGLVPVATAGAAPVAHSAKLPALTLTMNGKSIKVSGARVSGAVTVISKTKEAQSSPQLTRLNPGVTFAQAFRAVGRHHGDTNYLQGLAAVTYNTTNGKGTSSAQTVLKPGRYVAIDTIKNNPAKWPHVTFTVKKAKHAAKLPKAGATVKMIEFGFTGPSTWHVGETIRFADAGFLAHMVIGIKVANQAAAALVTKELQAGNDNAAQKGAIGFASFVGVASPGLLQQQKITASPGTYVLACFMNTQDGREHTRLGMERTITIAP